MRVKRRFAVHWCSLLLVAPAVDACATVPAEAGEKATFAVTAQEVTRFPPPGAAVALVKGKQSQFYTFGVERLGDGRPVTRDTVFQIASLTKPFTAIVILRLAEQHALTIDDRASKWLTWLPKRYDDVTIRQLLTHTSGVPRDLRRANVDEFSIAEFRNRLASAERSFPAGSQWEYSNTGYILLSLVAESASGRDFSELLRGGIFLPLEMRNSAYRAPLRAGPGRALGYDWSDGKWVPAPPVYSGFGNSGIETTVADLARFASALQERRLLSAGSYAIMLTPARLASGQTVGFDFRGAKASYGFGWFLTQTCGTPVAIHGGTIAGFSSNLSWATEKRLSVIALSNGKSSEDRIGVADKLGTATLRSALNC